MSKPNEIKASLLEDFSGKNEDATQWLLAMKAYFGMNNKIYKDEKNVVLVFLNKMSKGRGGTFAEGWYLKPINTDIPESERLSKNYAKLLKKPTSQKMSKIKPTKLSIP